MREIKFRAWDKDDLVMRSPRSLRGILAGEAISEAITCSYIFMQFTGLLDKNGKEIYFDDVLRFSDKWEWYRGQYGVKMMFAHGEELKQLQEEYNAEPYEERVVKSINDYEWLLSSEIQTDWEVIGNIHENPELLEEL